MQVGNVSSNWRHKAMGIWLMDCSTGWNHTLISVKIEVGVLLAGNTRLAIEEWSEERTPDNIGVFQAGNVVPLDFIIVLRYPTVNLQIRLVFLVV